MKLGGKGGITFRRLLFSFLFPSISFLSSLILGFAPRRFANDLFTSAFSVVSRLAVALLYEQEF